MFVDSSHVNRSDIVLDISSSFDFLSSSFLSFFLPSAVYFYLPCSRLGFG